MAKQQMLLRIIGGKFKGKKIKLPFIDEVRPSTDRIKETLFNWLMFRIEGATCLDLFTGSGSLALEAVSRGAKKVVALDKSIQAIDHLNKLKDELKIDNMTVVNADILTWLPQHKNQYDVIFLDPPYMLDVIPDLIKVIFDKNLLAPQGVIYFEINKDILSLCEPFFTAIKMKKAGNVYYYLGQS